jgi:hypothetical protein
VRLWYYDDIDAIQGWLVHRESRMTASAIPQFALHYGEVIRWTRGTKLFFHEFTMVYAKVMLKKHVNWTTMTVCSYC